MTRYHLPRYGLPLYLSLEEAVAAGFERVGANSDGGFYSASEPRRTRGMPSCCIRIFRDLTGKHLNDEPVDSRVTKSLIRESSDHRALRTNKRKEKQIYGTGALASRCPTTFSDASQRLSLALERLRSRHEPCTRKWIWSSAITPMVWLDSTLFAQRSKD
jgi:hypothetical protein